MATTSGPKPLADRPKKGRSKIAEPEGIFAMPPPSPQYFEHKGLRKVRPYWYAFNSYAKERWQGRSLIDVYSEFRDRSNEYYEWCIETGAIIVNNQQTSPQYVLKNGDLISNVVHRHEPAVVAGPIHIIYDGRLPGNDGETLVVEKPGSMPVHSTGRYHFNTLLSILKHDYDLPLVHTSNRLDRLTSGVMVCALTVEASKKLGAWFGNQRKDGASVHKEYVARCVGHFPDGVVTCEEPLLTIDRQIGINVVHPQGRHAKTIFTRISYHATSNTSVVHCRPITGRSHQIRVHLQFLGFPIANDPIYHNSTAWGERGGKGGVFGGERDGPNVDRQSRRDQGDLLMNRAKQQGVDLATMTLSCQSTTDEQDPLNACPEPDRLQDGLAVASDELVSLDRKAHDRGLTLAARDAILALRDVKDEADGWARSRDLRGIEQAKEGRSRGCYGAAEKAMNGATLKNTFDRGDELELNAEAGSDDDPNSEFCGDCFTPLVRDPRPEQLFIWLHALRYHTTEWDFSSPLPYWAEGEYTVPLTSILA